MIEGEGRVVGVVSEADLLPKEGFRDGDPDRCTRLRRPKDLETRNPSCRGHAMSRTSPTARRGVAGPLGP